MSRRRSSAKAEPLPQEEAVEAVEAVVVGVEAVVEESPAPRGTGATPVKREILMNGTLHVYVYKEGLLARLGHDLRRERSVREVRVQLNQPLGDGCELPPVTRGRSPGRSCRPSRPRR